MMRGRLRSRMLVLWYSIPCMFVGHRYDRHFTKLLFREPSTSKWSEWPWCDRCGKEMP